MSMGCRIRTGQQENTDKIRQGLAFYVPALSFYYIEKCPFMHEFAKIRSIS